MQRKYSELDIGEHIVGSTVWIKSSTESIYKEVVVKTVTGNVLTVSIDGETQEVDASECLNSNVGVEPQAIYDLAKLTHANEAAALDVIQKRYMKDEIYTYAGRLLVVMNPFKLINGLYDSRCLTKYQATQATHGFPTDVPPHTYAVAQVALNTMKSTKECQSCITFILLSGESGAGKTETARHLMQYFAAAKVQIGGKKAIQDVILGANPLLEALGNAKTVRNNNSSRFGRFVKLEVPEAGGICGGSISSYMLELSRVEFQAKNERNYHIFYQLIKALPQNVKNDIKLKAAEEYNFLNQSGCYEVSTVNDMEEFKLVQRQLDLILSDEEKNDYFKALSAILLAGNIQYENTQAMGTDKAGKVSNWKDFEIVCNLLGISATSCDKAITTTTVTIGGSAIESACSAEQANIVCKALAKEAYSTCFEFFIKRINKLIYFDDENKLWIGILDIYGFEFFEKNSYEQFLINYANEKLQQFFIQQVFQAEKAEYEVEGIDHSMITYSDNAEVILVFDKPKSSILSFLEEQCLLQTAPVLYSTEEFVAKNKHKIPNDLCELLKNSTNSAIKAAYEDYEIVDSKNMRGKFVGSKFQKSMGGLMLNLKKTNAHFIRCVKPNQQKAPRLFDAQTTLGQLICLSVFEAIGIIHKGFAYRSTFEEFVENNKILMNVVGAQTGGSDVKGACLSMLERIGVPKDQWQMGTTKIFIRKDGWLLIDRYFRQIMSKLSPLVMKLQSIYRAWKNRQFARTKLLHEKMNRILWAAVYIQSWWRMKSVQRILHEEKINIILGWTRGIEHIFATDPSASIKGIDIGAFHTVVYTNNGHLYSFGLNDRNQLGISTSPGLALPEYSISRHLLPINVKDVFCGIDHTLVLSEEGLVFAWGSNTRGQCGCAVVQKRVSEPTLVQFRNYKKNNMETVGYHQIKSISAGAYHNGAINGNGQLYIWGRHDHLNLPHLSSDLLLPTPMKVEPISQSEEIKAVVCGVGVTYIVKDDGVVFSFGQTTNGQLGLKTIRKPCNPRRIQELSRVKEIKCGPNLTLAVTNDEKVYEWGTFLFWDDTKGKCTKRKSSVPIQLRFDASRIQINPLHCDVGWWESAVTTAEGKLLGWNYLEDRGTGALSPSFYQYDLASNKKIRWDTVTFACLFSSRRKR
ncbi:myosin H [Cardiosporidium cionae]|uniref:Myosin H n=1 Tax=Cardiosporidium cionae TaxID=476202 RepID=A0ABQ7J4K3_9APIC|nr:myosin H [Cardiosporidium cionae]|eukprot:KAF8818153.1 myosin H [Cardiosporidium cionae]